LLRASFFSNLPSENNIVLKMWNNSKVLVVIPCYKVASLIEQTVAGLPEWVDGIVLVNDCSPDQTGEVLRSISSRNPKVILLEHGTNLGVGGAMVTGFNYAAHSDYDIVVKMDGDGQMDPLFLPNLLQPLQEGEADFSKGNRFNDFKALQRMPVIRRFGNLGLSFLIKAASGYWDVFDPTNGFFAISSRTLHKLNVERLAPRYFFESSLLIELYYTGAVIKDVPMPAIYGEETSNLSVARTLFGFPPKLFKALRKRIRLCYFVYDFNMVSIYMLGGLPMFLFGLVFGLVKWIQYASIDMPAPTGTVMLAVLPFILGFQMLLSAVQHDIHSKNPFSRK
jgi:dolichol-phosphate mannosyltransferase